MVRLIILLTIIATICVTMIKPQMHKPLMVYNSDYKIVTQTQDTIKDQEPEDIPTINQKETTVAPIIEKIEQKADVVFTPPKSNIEKSVKTKDPTVTTKKVTSTSQTVVTEKKSVPQSTKNVVEKSTQNNTTQTKNPVETVITQPAKQEEKIVVQPKTVKQEANTVTKPQQQTNTQQTPAQVKPQTQTVHLPAVQPTKTAAQIAQEEEIAWNKWRSRLQNQIMADVRMPNIPYGVIFKFSFTVDKYGKITNVQTWSTTPNYTPHAIQYIAPVIRSYQGHSILNFPAGSNRVTTEVVGAWKISNSSKYSTPQDYNDTERITK